MDTNFEFSDFIENVNFDRNQTHSILDEIRYLVKKISLLERKCKEVMLQAQQEYPDEYPEPSPAVRQSPSKDNGDGGDGGGDGGGADNENNAGKSGGNREANKARKEREEGQQNENVNETPSQQQQSPQQPPPQPDAPEEDAPSPSRPEKILEPDLEKLITRMYKRIALKYHPDKCGDKYRSVFLSATEAAEEKNLTKLLYIFALQEINMTFNEDELKYVEAIKIRLEQKLSMILSSPLTKWEILSERMKRRIARSLAKMG